MSFETMAHCASQFDDSYFDFSGNPAAVGWFFSTEAEARAWSEEWWRRNHDHADVAPVMMGGRVIEWAVIV